MGLSTAAFAARTWYELRFRDARPSKIEGAKPETAVMPGKGRPIVLQGKTIAYAFDPPGGGCVAIAADDELPPVFYYSQSHRLTLPAVPPAQAIIESLARRIAEVRDASERRTGPRHPSWSRLLGGPEPERAGRPLGSYPSAAVGPLLSSAWHQREPYNLQCPTVEGEECPVGCTALAMAQIMRYWQWPETPPGQGSHCYYWSLGQTTLCADFASAAYDWANMPDRAAPDCPQAVKDALSTLCYHCGVSIDSQYTPHASSGGALAAGLSLARYFRYGYTRVIEKLRYDDAEWYNLIADQIDKAQPVLCVIMWGDLPHTVVLDGHNSPDLVHLNMGWGGSGDGWYALGDLPRLGVIDIRPHRRATTLHVDAASGDDAWDGTTSAKDTQGHGPKRTIQAAIDAVRGPNDRVIVGDGFYTGERNKELTFGPGRLIGNTPLAIRSARGPASCVIDCQGAGRAFSLVSGMGELVRLVGFTICNGRGGDFGGAIYSSNSGPTVTNCVIYGSSATRGGGAYCVGSPSPRFNNCVICGNTATYGGAICSDGTQSPTVVNCVICRNVAESRGGGLCWCSAPIRNCIIRGNTAPEGAQLYDSGDAAHCCIEGWTEGSEGNIDRNPLFANADGLDDEPETYDDNDYRLSKNSPCIDAGDNSALISPGLDLDGNLRIAFGRTSLTVDMGAYEYGSRPFAVRQISVDNGSLQLTWNSQPNAAYTIWSCLDLLASDWIEEAAIVPSGGETSSWGNTMALVPPKFYRIEME